MKYYQKTLFNNNILCEAIYTLISLISDGFLYSNFCIEFKDKRGKIITIKSDYFQKVNFYKFLAYSIYIKIYLIINHFISLFLIFFN